MSYYGSYNILIDFSSFDKILVHLKLLTCFVLPGLFSAIRSFQKMPLKLNELEPVMYKHVYKHDV